MGKQGQRPHSQFIKGKTQIETHLTLVITLKMNNKSNSEVGCDGHKIVKPGKNDNMQRWHDLGEMGILSPCDTYPHHLMASLC